MNDTSLSARFLDHRWRESPPQRPHRSLRERLRRWWQWQCMDDQTRFLSQATSHIDLEHRLRIWEEDNRRRAWMWLR